MNLSMNVKLSRAPGEGLTDFCAMAASDSIVSATIESEDSNLVVFKVDQGSNPLSGIVGSDPTYAMLAYASQMTQLVRIQKTFLRNTFRTSSEANLIAPNGDTVHFTFEVPADYVFDELAASQPEQE